MQRVQTFVGGLLLAWAGIALGGDEYELEPIRYSATTPDNAISRLQRRLDRGDDSLAFDEKLGYLPALLDALDIPVDTQTLVFSKTSLQRGLIHPRTPRALYFNDETYVGFCQNGGVLEISTADPQLGTVFYTLDQERAEAPVLERETESCLQCHGTSQTGNIPGHLLRSVFTDASGLPLLAEGSHRVDDTTPFENRWGGWYVTGTHGEQKHLGNLVIRKQPVPRPITNEQGQNVTDLSGRFKVDRYPSPHSDIVALMVLEHQTHVHNLITRANYATRQALHYEKSFNEALGEPATNRLDSTTRRIKSAGDQLVEGLLFVKEAPLTAPVRGTSSFQTTFPQRGPRDAQGRSLRDFDLQTRLFRYPCSYLIDSPAFRALPAEMSAYVAGRLRTVLADDNDEPAFARLSREDRRAIREILQATRPDLWEGAAESPAAADRPANAPVN